MSFRYRPELPDIHRDVTFNVPADGMTAFVGPSGAGKSTVFALIERFHEVAGGRVLVDGQDVRDWSLPRLRSAIGYAEQDAPVLAGTLRENLLFAAPDASDKELHEVLTRTRLDTLVARLPDGLDTPVGHRGSKLSGGERQRVAIARALLRRPRRCSSTRRPRSSTPSTNSRCATSWRRRPGRPPSWWWPTGCPG